MTGVDGAGESSLLLPPCPATTARSVLTDLIDHPDAVTGALRAHGPAATRRRWTRALIGPAVLAAGLVAMSFVVGVPIWVWPVLAVLTACCALLAADRSRSLGHRVGDGWLVARSGSIERRRDCVDGAGVVGWTVRQSWFQRRAGVATLVAATAAGVKAYRVVDVPAGAAWSVAAAVSPWLAGTGWARTGPGPELR
jgi:putative membrane protein